MVECSVQSLSCVQLFATPWTAAHQASQSFTNSWNVLKFMSIELVMWSNHLILCSPLLLPSIFPSIRVFSNESALCSDSCPLSQWYHPTISSSTAPSPPAFNLSSLGVFPSEMVLCIRRPNIGASASVSVLPMNIQGWFPLRWTVLISLLSKGLSRVFSSTTIRKY